MEKSKHRIGSVAGTVLMRCTCPRWDQVEEQAGAQAGRHPAGSHRAGDCVPGERPSRKPREAALQIHPGNSSSKKGGFTTVQQGRLYLHTHI